MTRADFRQSREKIIEANSEAPKSSEEEDALSPYDKNSGTAKIATQGQQLQSFVIRLLSGKLLIVGIGCAENGSAASEIGRSWSLSSTTIFVLFKDRHDRQISPINNITVQPESSILSSFQFLQRFLRTFICNFCVSDLTSLLVRHMFVLTRFWPIKFPISSKFPISYRPLCLRTAKAKISV